MYFSPLTGEESTIVTEQMHRFDTDTPMYWNNFALCLHISLKANFCQVNKNLKSVCNLQLLAEDPKESLAFKILTNGYFC